MNKEQIEKYLKKHWANKSNPELCKAIGKSDSQLRRYARKLHLPQKEGGGSNRIEFKRLSVPQLKLEKEKQDTVRFQKKNIEKLLTENKQLTRTLDTLIKVREIKTFMSVS